MGKYLDSGGLSHLIGKIKTLIGTKQDTLVSGTNIKTVNNESLLGSGNISVDAHQTLTDVVANEYAGEEGMWSLYWDGDGEASYIANVPALYGTCNTAASNTTKQVSCDNAAGKTVYEDGTVLNVYFSTANTATGQIYLNVGQNTGSVYVHGSVTGSSNPLLWDAGTILTFVRSGSIWRYVGSDAVSPSAQMWTASWAATSSAANNVQLTNSLTLPAGTYVITLNLPNTSTNVYAELYPVDSHYGQAPSLGSMSWIVTLTAQTTLYARTAMSTSCSYTYTNRGRLTAVRVAGVGTGGSRFERKTSGLGVTWAAASGFTITRTDEYADGGLYHAHIYIKRTSSMSALSALQIATVSGLAGATICSNSIWGSVSSINGNAWCTVAQTYAANTQLEAEVVGFLA